jgi:cysteine desulfurase
MEADCGTAEMIYLDYQATTPLAPEAREAMLPWLTIEGSANPHSAHAGGRAARAAVEVAREQVAALLPDGGQVFFTSGATEAANWALRGFGDGGIATLATEHACVLDTADALGRAVVLPVLPSGLAPDVVIPQGTGLVAAMLVNNEIGVVQSVTVLADAAHAARALFFCDAVQGYGRVAIPDCCDMIAISAHKIHGPKGIGALWVRDGVVLAPLMTGGGQEGGLRSGTLSPALCAGFGAAAALAARRFETDHAHVERLWALSQTKLGDWQINGSTKQRYHGNLNIRRDGLDAARIISELRDIAISAGSACASGSGRPSHVLTALGLSREQARCSLRIGFGRYTTDAELAEALDRINTAADRQQAIAA